MRLYITREITGETALRIQKDNGETLSVMGNKAIDIPFIGVEIESDSWDEVLEWLNIKELASLG